MNRGMTRHAAAELRMVFRMRLWTKPSGRDSGSTRMEVARYVPITFENDWDS